MILQDKVMEMPQIFTLWTLHCEKAQAATEKTRGEELGLPAPITSNVIGEDLRGPAQTVDLWTRETTTLILKAWFVWSFYEAKDYVEIIKANGTSNTGII